MTAAEAGRIDTAIVAGGDRLAEEPLDADLLATTRTVTARAARVASVCTGAFVLAELGLLDARRAATHWRHADTLARRHPRVCVEPDAIHVRDGRFISSAGISAGIDLPLALVEDDHGPGVARRIARELVVFMQRPGGQSQFTTATTPPARDGLLRTLIDAVLADPAADHGLPSMARAAAVSPRHLTRLFHAELWLRHRRDPPPSLRPPPRHNPHHLPPPLHHHGEAPLRAATTGAAWEVGSRRWPPIRALADRDRCEAA